MHLDVFNDDAFGLVEMTTALERVPYIPQFLGSLGIFEPRPITTQIVSLEERESKLSLIQTSPRGAPPTEHTKQGRKLRHFNTVRLKTGDTLYAAEIAGIRAFGTEDEFETAQTEMFRREVSLRNNQDLTHEFHRLGAIQGIVLDADGSTIINWFDEFDITQPAEINFDLTNANSDIITICNNLARTMARNAQGAFLPTTQIYSLTGDAFFDALTNHPKVVATYQNWQAAQSLRENKAFTIFPFGGINWVNYRGTDDGSKVAVNTNSAKFFPVGAPGVFVKAQSPGESFDVVNTPGRDFYAQVITDKDRNEWIRAELASYFLYMCTTPKVLLRGKRTA